MKKILFAILFTFLLSACVSSLEPDRSCGDFVPIEFEGNTLYVSPDYYMIDGVRTPVGMSDALRIAEENNAFLPTPAMVDAIWTQADCRLDPITMPPGPQMTSIGYYERHHALIEEQLFHSDYESCELIAGHKKDIVQNRRNGRVTIYGWHRSNGVPIQPVSSIHGAEYRDYSHGLRLVRWPD